MADWQEILRRALEKAEGCEPKPETLEQGKCEGCGRLAKRRKLAASGSDAQLCFPCAEKLLVEVIKVRRRRKGVN